LKRLENFLDGVAHETRSVAATETAPYRFSSFGSSRAVEPGNPGDEPAAACAGSQGAMVTGRRSTLNRRARIFRKTHDRDETHADRRRAPVWGTGGIATGGLTNASFGHGARIVAYSGTHLAPETRGRNEAATAATSR
jgi:hypothetical protein